MKATTHVPTTRRPPTTQTLFVSAFLLLSCAGVGKAGTVASIRLTEGWATFGQVVPRGAAPSGLRIGQLETQVDIKNRWDDGSVRFAVLTARIERPGRYLVLDADAPPGDSFEPTSWPDVVVQVNTSDAALSARLPPPTGDLWLHGPLAVESRAIVAPASAVGDAHKFLRVIFDVRYYRDDSYRVDVTVENVLDQPIAGQVAYSVRVLAGGEELFARERVIHPYLTRWRRTFFVGERLSSLTPDFEPCFAAGALPRYMSALIVDENRRSDFDILTAGRLNKSMPAPGGRSEIAPYPDWTAIFLAHRTEAQKRTVLRQGELAGSWPVHVRNPDLSLVRLDERPNYWMDPRSEPENKPRGGSGMKQGLGELRPDNNHQPSLAYVPYLTTGDRFFADEMAFWANYVVLSTWPGTRKQDRGGGEGLIEKHNDTRGFAWGLRNLVDCAAYLPDASPYSEYFGRIVTNNLAFLDRYAASHQPPLGTVFEGKFKDSTNNVYISTWQREYLAWSIDHANAQGFRGGLAVRDRIVRFTLDMFLSPDYPREFGAPMVNVHPVGVRSGDTIDYFDTYAELFERGIKGSRNAAEAWFDHHGKSARLMILIAMREGWEGADQAYAYLNPFLAERAYWPGGVTQLGRAAGWALAPETVSASATTKADAQSPVSPANLRRAR